MADPFDDPAIRSAFGAAGVVHRPGMADELLREMAPLLAEEGIDLNDPSTFDLASLNAAMTLAVERTNMERFTPHGGTRASALTVLRLTSEAIAEGSNQLAEAVIHGVEPEPRELGKPSIAHVIGVGLGLLDTWHTDPGRTGKLSRTSVPRWNGSARKAGTDIVALARKGRAFDSIGSLHGKYNGLVILEGSILAVTGTLQAWGVAEGQSVRELGAVVLAEAP